MRARIFGAWETLMGGFWVVPSLMALGAYLLTRLTLYIDSRYAGADEDDIAGFVFTGQADAAREILSTVAGSMITVVSIVFSITVLAMQMASQQYGPRLLRNFTKDKGNQIVLGTFISAFIFSLVILRNISDEDSVPKLSVTVGFLFGIIGFAVLIYFIHHVSVMIRAGELIATVWRELHDSIRDSHKGFHVEMARHKRSSDPVVDFTGESRPLLSKSSGYIRGIEIARLVQLAHQHNLRIKMWARSGDFLVEGQPVMQIYGAVKSSADDELWRCVVIDHIRGTSRDPEFLIRQLVEIGVRALSPSMNDPFTAINCIDYLAAGLCLWADGPDPQAVRSDKTGEPRVVLDITGFEGLMDSAFHQLRQNADGKPAILTRLMEAFSDISHRVDRVDRERAVRRHADMVLEKAKLTLDDPNDLADVERRYLRCLKVLEASLNGQTVT
jgi:uncharacterized membrane protein